MNDWIPVSKKLPEKSGRYLVTYQNRTMKRIREVDVDLYTSSTGFKFFDSIAWMPLPEPYKEDSDG